MPAPESNTCDRARCAIWKLRCFFVLVCSIPEQRDHPSMHKRYVSFFTSIPPVAGFVYCNLPGLRAAVGERVRLYIMAIGTDVDMHTPSLNGVGVFEQQVGLVGGRGRDDALQRVFALCTDGHGAQRNACAPHSMPCTICALLPLSGCGVHEAKAGWLCRACGSRCRCGMQCPIACLARSGQLRQWGGAAFPHGVVVHRRRA